jgi:hypothetical protein
MPSNQQDVRVKISAEGIAEVVQAFQKISSEAKKSGKEAASGFSELNKQFGELGKNLLGGLGLALLADKFKEMFKSALEGSEVLTRLSAQTGISTGAIQALQRAARETGLSTEVANAAMVKFTAAIGKAEIGSKQSATALADLGIKASEISKLSPDQQLTKVAGALSKIADPARRARDEMALFGRSGVEMDQALIKVGTEGFAPFIAHLQELGLYLDQDAIASLKAASESFRQMGDTVKGVATQFITGLVPGLSAAVDELTRASNSSGVSGFKAIGEGVGVVFRAVVNAMEHAGNNIAGLVVKTQIFFGAIAKGASAVVHGNLAEIKSIAKEAASELAAVQQANEERNAEADKRMSAPPETHKPAPTGGGGAADPAGGTTSQMQALSKARYDLLAVQLDNELKLVEIHAKLEGDIAKNQYDQGLLSLTDYYAKRAALTNAEYDKRIATAQAKAKAEAQLPIADSDTGTAAVQKQTAQAKLQGQIADLQAQRVEALKSNTDELASAQNALDEKTIAAQERLLTLEGKKQQAAQLRLAADLKALDLELKQGGASDPDRQAALSSAAQAGQGKINFDQTQGSASSNLSQLNSQIKTIQDSVRDGQTFSIAAQQQIIQLEQSKLPVLQQEAAELMQIATLSKDPALIAQAEAFKEKIDAIAVSTNQVGQQMAKLQQGVEGAVGDGITKFLTDASKGTKTLKQDFSDAAMSIVSDIEKIATEMVAHAALNALFGGGAGGGGGGGGGGIGGVGGLLGSGISSLMGGGGMTLGSTAAMSTDLAASSDSMVSSALDAFTFAASGGLIRGRGTSTSDSIPARLSDKEFVVNAKAVQTPGVLPLLHAINGGGVKGSGGTSVPKYAEGGVVGGHGAAPNIKMVNVLDPTLLGDHLQTQEGEQGVLNIISRNPNKVRNATR